MKKLSLVAMALICSVAFTDCAAKKVKKTEPVSEPQPVVQQESETQRQIRELKEQQELKRIQHEMELEEARYLKELGKTANEVTTYNIPCMESSYDDEDYFRDYGIGTVQNGNDQLARQDANAAAKNMIKMRLGEYVQGMTDFYFESYSDNNSDKDAAANRTRNKLNGVIDGMLNNADKICESPGVDAKGTRHWYYTIQIPKKELNKKLMDVFSEDQKLRRDFDAEQMQKFMDERMEQMLEAKKAAGY